MASDADEGDGDAASPLYCRLPRFRRIQDSRWESTIAQLLARYVLNTV